MRILGSLHPRPLGKGYGKENCLNWLCHILTIKHHDKGTVTHHRQLVCPEPDKSKAATLAKDGKPSKHLRITLWSVSVAVNVCLFKVANEVACSLWSRSTEFSVELQCKVWLFGDSGLSCCLHGEGEGGNVVPARSEVISCRWVGDSAREASKSELSGQLLHAGQAHEVGGRKGEW